MIEAQLKFLGLDGGWFGLYDEYSIVFISYQKMM